MGREIQRSYLPTPELLKDGVRISTVPINLAAGDWNGLNRLLETMRKAIIEPQGTITGRTFRTAVEPDKRVQIDTANGIRIYDSGNNLVAQFDGDELTIAGGTITGATIIGSTFKTAVSPNARVEIDSTNGLRVYNSSNTLVAQLDGSAITLIGGTITGATFKTAASPNARVEIDSTNGIRIYNSTNTLVAQLTQTLVGSSYFNVTEAAITGSLRISSIINAAGAGTAMSINAGTGPIFGGSAEYIIDGSAAQGKHQFKADGTVRVTVNPSGLTINSGALTVTSGNSVITSGNLTLTSGNLVLSSGNINFSGSLTGPNIHANTALQTDTGDIYLGNAASSVLSMIKASATTVKVRKADNSGYADFECGALTPTSFSYSFGGMTTGVVYSDGLSTHTMNFIDGILYSIS